MTRTAGIYRMRICLHACVPSCQRKLVLRKRSSAGQRLPGTDYGAHIRCRLLSWAATEPSVNGKSVNFREAEADEEFEQTLLWATVEKP